MLGDNENDHWGWMITELFLRLTIYIHDKGPLKQENVAVEAPHDYNVDSV